MPHEIMVRSHPQRPMPLSDSSAERKRKKEGRSSVKVWQIGGERRSDGDGSLAFDLTIPRGPIVVAACALPAASFEIRFDDAPAPADYER